MICKKKGQINIGIIIYTWSGNTLSIAQKLEEKLSSAGHKVSLEQLETAAPLKLGAQMSELKSIPSIKKYDVLVLASPVHGGRISSPIASFLEGTPSLLGKKVALLATHFLPFGWGGKQMIRSMKEVCEAKGAQIIGEGSVPWANFQPKRYIDEVVNKLAKLI